MEKELRKRAQQLYLGKNVLTVEECVKENE